MNEVTTVPDAIVYPESDGKPMADNTLQWEWMVRIVGELREQFKDQNVFVAGDLFWYPVQGDTGTVVAPDGLVVFGRPQQHRGSYKQWEEDNIAPQVVFEVKSPSNTRAEMDEKEDFYDRHGVEEYYHIDPYENELEAFVRRGSRLRSVKWDKGFTSPRLGIRFEHREGELIIIKFEPDQTIVLSTLDDLHSSFGHTLYVKRTIDVAGDAGDYGGWPTQTTNRLQGNV